MLTIMAYKCSDGTIFENVRKAQEHQKDLIGDELEKLLKLFKLDITRNQEFKGILSAIENQKELLKHLKAVLFTLEHGEEEEEEE